MDLSHPFAAGRWNITAASNRKFRAYVDGRDQQFEFGSQEDARNYLRTYFDEDVKVESKKDDIAVKNQQRRGIT